MTTTNECPENYNLFVLAVIFGFDSSEAGKLDVRNLEYEYLIF